MKWHEYTLEQLGTVGRGRSRHRPRNDSKLYGGAYPFIQTGEVKEANLYITRFEQTYNEFGLSQSKLWDSGTLLITIAANIAESAILSFPACFPDSIVGFIADKSKTSERFIKYYIDFLKLEMQSASRGTTQDNLSLDKLLTFNFKIPPRSVQLQIENVLVALDNALLINERRINKLEQIAQLLHCEWFVNFKYPGHESLKLVDSGHPDFGIVPEGWEITKVEDLLDSAPKSKKLKSSEYLSDGMFPIVDQGQEFIAGYTNEAEALISSPLPIIVFGDHTRKLKLINFPFARGADGTQLIISKRKEIPQHLLYQTLIRLDLSNHHYARHFKFLKDSFVLVPGLKEASKYEQTVKPMFEMIENLRRQNTKIKRMRDLLLPKLVSGEIDVSNLSLETTSEEVMSHIKVNESERTHL